MKKKKFKKLALGGTFDGIHKGHEKLISGAFKISEFVLIGISDDDFVKKIKKFHSVDSYEKRKKSMKKFLRERNFENRSEIIPLKNEYGPAIDDESIDSIIVSKESERTAYDINKIRLEKGIPPLSIISIELVLADNGKPISTTRIKKKKIDKNGHLVC